MPRKTSREDLMTAATDVFFEKGFHNALVSEIVAAAGVSQGTFYQYFPSKETAFIEIVNQIADELRAVVASVYPETMESAEQYQRDFGAAYRVGFQLVADRRRAAALLLQQAPLVGGEAAKTRRSLIDEMDAMTQIYLTQGIEKGFLRTFDVPIISRAVIGLLMHTFSRTIIEEGQTENLDVVAEEILRFELTGTTAE